MIYQIYVGTSQIQRFIISREKAGI